MLLLPTIALLCLWNQPFQVIGNIEDSVLQNSKKAVRFNLGSHGSECWFAASAFSGHGKAKLYVKIYESDIKAVDRFSIESPSKFNGFSVSRIIVSKQSMKYNKDDGYYYGSVDNLFYHPLFDTALRIGVDGEHEIRCVDKKNTSTSTIRIAQSYHPRR